jgi:hypothetical protein
MTSAIARRDQPVTHLAMPCVAESATMMCESAVFRAAFGMMNRRLIFAD